MAKSVYFKVTLSNKSHKKKYRQQSCIASNVSLNVSPAFFFFCQGRGTPKLLTGLCAGR